MEQVLAPRFEFKPKNPATSTATPGFDYGEGGYDPDKCNVGFHEERGVFQIEIKGLTEPKTPEAARICREDLNEVIASRSEEHTSELQSLMRISYAVFCLKKKTTNQDHKNGQQ